MQVMSNLVILILSQCIAFREGLTVYWCNLFLSSLSLFNNMVRESFVFFSASVKSTDEYQSSTWLLHRMLKKDSQL